MSGSTSPSALFDSHCHVHDPVFDDDRARVLERAREVGVREVVTVGVDPVDAGRAREVVESVLGGTKVPRLWHTVGLHPHEARRWSDEVGEGIERELGRGAVAVGETGLDFHYDNSPRDDQRRAFAGQVAIAVEAGRPLVIHSREADDETLAILAAGGIPADRVVLHCFSGSRAMLEQGVARGHYVSFSGMVTFKSFAGEELVPLVPSDRLLAETDAPYLAPAPHRGKRNEPGFVARTVERLAELRGWTVAEAARRTRANALRFYGLD